MACRGDTGVSGALVALMLVSVGALSGCARPDQTPQRGGEIAHLESYLVQFRAWNLTASACEEAREVALGASYVANVGECHIASSRSDDGQASNDT